MLKRLTTCLTAALTLLAITTTAFAQTPEIEVGRDAEEPATVTAKVTAYDYEDDEITGTLQHPLGDVVGGDAARKLGNLITIRASFQDELIKSSEDL